MSDNQKKSKGLKRIMSHILPGNRKKQQPNEEPDINQPSGSNSVAQSSRSQSVFQRQPIESNLNDISGSGIQKVQTQLPMYWSHVGQDYMKPVPANKPLIDKQIAFLKAKGIRFERYLGTETYGPLWKARVKSTGLQENLTCKVISLKTFDTNKTRLTSVEEAVDGMFHEINILRELNHQNIIKMLFVITVPDSLTKFKYSAVYMFSEAFDGTLYQLIETTVARLLREDECKQWFTQIACAVRYLHQKNVVHMNINPKSIRYYIKRNRLFKLSDFCYAIDFGGSQQTYCSVQLSGEFMAPEVKGCVSYENGYDAKAAHMWSLCFTLMAAAVGVSDQNRLMSLISGSEDNNYMPSPPSEQLADLIRQLFKIDPNERLTIDQVCSHQWLNC